MVEDVQPAMDDSVYVLALFLRKEGVMIGDEYSTAEKSEILQSEL